MSSDEDEVPEEYDGLAEEAGEGVGGAGHDDEDLSGEDSDTPSKKKKKATGKGKGKNKIVAANKVIRPKAEEKRKPGQKKGGGRSKIADDYKMCKGCQKAFPRIEMPVGSAYCHPDKRATQNMGKAAKRQKNEQWWESVESCPRLLKRTLIRYHKKFPTVMDEDGEMEPGPKKKPKVLIAEFEEEHRQEMQLLIDKVMEMMDLRQYRCWMAKPKNGSKDADWSNASFTNIFTEGDTLTDTGGSEAKFRDRIAVKIKDLVTERDLESMGMIVSQRQANKRCIASRHSKATAPTQNRFRQ